MAYSDGALQLQNLDIGEMPRAEDRLSFLYLDTCRVRQDETGLLAERESGEHVRIPVASVGVLLLGPGTSITSRGMATLHRAGAGLIVVASDGAVAYAAARPLTARSHWVEAQARMVTDSDARLSAARALYGMRFPDVEWPPDAPLSVLRGIEGAQVRQVYRELASRYRMGNWRRETDSTKTDDPINPLLNLTNSVLYGAALTATSALGLSPALGVIHQGSANALLLDLADAYKPLVSIPVAFEAGQHSDGPERARRLMREQLYRHRVVAGMLEILQQLLGLDP